MARVRISNCDAHQSEDRHTLQEGNDEYNVPIFLNYHSLEVSAGYPDAKGLPGDPLVDGSNWSDVTLE